MTRRRARSIGVGSFFALAFLSTQLLPAAASTTVAQAAPSERGSGKHGGALVVRLRPGVSESTAATLFKRVGASEVGRIDQLDTRVVVARGNPVALRRALAASPLVQSVDDDGTAKVMLTPNDPLWSNEWYARKVRAPLAWDTTIGAGAPVIAVLDTGVQADHPDLAGRVLSGWDFINRDAYAGDSNGHGTAVAGVAAGAGMNGRGIAGLCWRCKILPAKVADSNGNIYWSNVAAAISWAADRGADVINMSFGGFTGSNAVANAVAYARSKGVVVVAAAGNNGISSKFYPAAYPGVVSVAATTTTDTLYSWSNRGSWVKVAAPGCTYTTAKGGGYRSFCGTSASAPVVAGAAGLVMSAHPTVGRNFVEEALITTAVRFSGAIGGGRLDASKAVGTTSEPASTPPPEPEPEPDPATTPKDIGACPNQRLDGLDGMMEWHGELRADSYGRTCTLKLGGWTRFEAAYGDPGLKFVLRNEAGDVVARLGGVGSRYERMERRLSRQTYRLTIKHAADGDAGFGVRLTWWDPNDN